MGNNGLDDDGDDDGTNPNTDFTNVNFAYSSLAARTIKFESLETQDLGEGGPNFKKAHIGVSNPAGPLAPGSTANFKFSDNFWGGADFSSASLRSGEGARM